MHRGFVAVAVSDDFQQVWYQSLGDPGTCSNKDMHPQFANKQIVTTYLIIGQTFEGAIQYSTVAM